MTDIELLEEAVKMLGGINVPIALFDSIGVPVYRVRSMLNALLASVPKKEPDCEAPSTETEVETKEE